MTMLKLLQSARKFNASDIHIVAGLPPVFRVNGEIVTSKGEAMEPSVIKAMIQEVLNAEQAERLKKDLQLCISMNWREGGEGGGKGERGEMNRCRVSIYYRNSSPELSIRMSESSIRTRAELRLPAIVDEMARRPHGLIIISGPTGVGKTTTFHYIIDLINAEYRKKIVTIEDPIEYTHRYKRSIVIQQEVLADVHDFSSALRHVLRQDPDVIAIGEMRDRETVYTALMAAETGHLVIATLHTPSTIEVVQRITTSFPEGQQDEIRLMLAGSLNGVIAQHLLPRVDGSGRVLCYETLVSSAGVRNKIRDNNIHLLYSEIQSGRKDGMITMDHALLELYQQGEISYDTAITMARFPEDIKRRSA